MEGAYYSRNAATLDRAATAYRRLAERYEEWSALNNLASVVLPDLEFFDEALKHARAMQRLGSTDAFAAQSLVVAHLNTTSSTRPSGRPTRWCGSGPLWPAPTASVASPSRTSTARTRPSRSRRRAHELDPNNQDTMGALVGNLFTADRFGEGRAMAQPLSESMDPTKRSMGLMMLGNLATYSGRTREAMDHFVRATRAEGGAGPSPALAAARTLLLMRGEAGPALEHVETARREAGPLDLAQEALYWKARCLAGAGRHDEARAALVQPGGKPRAGRSPGRAA